MAASSSDASRLDVLALAAHPDDVELCAGGTMCVLAAQGYRTGIIDFTRGELGSRGTPEGRLEEAARAAEVMGLAVRENLGLQDGAIADTHEHRLRLMRLVRRHRPRVVLINSAECRHPDHCAAARLALHTLYYGGLRKLETQDADGPQEPYRPPHVLHYMQAVPFEPSLVVDVTDVWDRRIEALQAFRSQFYNPDYESDEPETYVSNRTFFEWVEGRAREYGQRVGVTYGEPLRYVRGPIGVRDLMQTLDLERAFV